jgi:cobalt-precorrin 5A hydrolase
MTGILLMSTAGENSAALIVLTKGGAELAFKLKKDNKNYHLYLPQRLLKEYKEEKDMFSFPDWKITVKYIFNNYNKIVFVMAVGIVVRTIAPLIKDKRTDPAVVVVDEKGRFPISFLSGHIGGANALCKEIAEILHVDPVITTATDVNNRPAVDMLAKELNCKMPSSKKLKFFNRLLAEGEKLELFTSWPKIVDKKEFHIRPITDLEDADTNINSKGIIIITNKTIKVPKVENLILNPGNLIVGVGCRRGISRDEILEAVEKVFINFNLAVESIKLIASIDLKADEVGIIETAKHLGVSFITFSAEELNDLEDKFTESQFVKKITGVGGVCEPAAKKASGMGKIIVPKQVVGKVTVAVAEERFM